MPVKYSSTYGKYAKYATARRYPNLARRRAGTVAPRKYNPRPYTVRRVNYRSTTRARPSVQSNYLAKRAYGSARRFKRSSRTSVRRHTGRRHVPTRLARGGFYHGIARGSRGYYRSRRSSRHGSKRAHATSETFYVSGGTKPSPAFKARVEESLSNPVTFSYSTGNVVRAPLVAPIVGSSKSYATGHYFQPHRIADVGSGPIPPTPVTEQACYLFDYFNVSNIFNSLYLNIGVVQNTLRQVIRLSGHMDYWLKNMTSEPVFVECTRWAVKKQPSYDLASIPGTTVSPVFTGNILNFIGTGIFLKSGEGTQTNALNTQMDNLQFKVSDLPLIDEFFETKTFIMRVGVGQTKHLSVGRKLLSVDTLENFSINGGMIAFAQPETWANPFIPGACGFVFRVRGNPAIIDANPRGDYSALAYTTPEMILTTKTTYVAYDWMEHPETEDHLLFSNSGLTGDVANSALNIVIPGLAAAQHPINA